MKFWSYEKLILKPDSKSTWLTTSAGATAGLAFDKYIQLYITGRDSLGRSQIGTAKFDLNTESIYDIAEKPILDLGRSGTFDQNGISYPSITRKDKDYYLYYTGWMLGSHVKWYNGVGLAISTDGENFEKFSEAPVFHRDQQNPIGFGSTCVTSEGKEFLAITTRFESWTPDGRNHLYNLKSGKSIDGLNFTWSKHSIFQFKEGEIAHSAPTILVADGLYLLWYSYRGENYRIGFAFSSDGIKWIREDEIAGLVPDDINENWAFNAVCYPEVVLTKNNLYLFFNGDGYGRTGLGFAKVELGELRKLIDKCKGILNT
jgi:predicted GH43/DUF377 family glycosyl hydrolase